MGLDRDRITCKPNTAPLSHRWFIRDNLVLFGADAADGCADLIDDVNDSVGGELIAIVDCSFSGG